MDQKDRQILEVLQEDAKTAQAEIARRVGLSPASVNERIHKVEQQGIIRRYVAILDDRKAGKDITAFIEVFIEHPRHEEAFIKLTRELEEVQEVHYVTGEFSCLLKVKVPDRVALREWSWTGSTRSTGSGRPRPSSCCTRPRKRPAWPSRGRRTSAARRSRHGNNAPTEASPMSMTPANPSS